MAARGKTPIQARFRLRLTIGERIAVGPGKVALLEAIRDHRSISAAAKALDMSYKRAWDLVNEINGSLREPAVLSLKGGSHGGGTALTPAGHALVGLYRTIEFRAQEASAKELAALRAMLDVRAVEEGPPGT